MLKNKRQSGLTLVETIVALYILTLSVVSVVGTALYAYTAYGRGEQKVIALNLAREGIEVARAIRDTNWLPNGGGNALTECPQLGAEQYCYPGWLTGLESCPSPDGCQAVFNTTNNTWSLENPAIYNLFLHPNGTYLPVMVAGQSPQFFRKVTIDPVSPAVVPYEATYPEVVVRTVVAWIGTGCDDFGGDPDDASASCRVILEDRLTNWKNY